jgi:hypothetical protein
VYNPMSQLDVAAIRDVAVCCATPCCVVHTACRAACRGASWWWPAVPVACAMRHVAWRVSCVAAVGSCCGWWMRTIANYTKGREARCTTRHPTQCAPI